jgi:hypothetical protein
MATEEPHEDITIGSDWRIADLKRDEAEGMARRVLTMVPPELWPAIVILDADPPIIGTPAFKTVKALIISLTARLVPPLGAMKPNCAEVSKGTSIIADEHPLHRACIGEPQRWIESRRRG